LRYGSGSFTGTLEARGGAKTGAGSDGTDGTVFQGPAGPCVLGISSISPTRGGNAGSVTLSVFGSCLAYTAHTYLSKAWNPVRAGTYAYLNPVIAVLLGVAFLGEPFNARMALGMAVILLGVALVQYRSRAD
jgi:drug/metabolite transporter (DMT)-like permease